MVDIIEPNAEALAKVDLTSIGRRFNEDSLGVIELASQCGWRVIITSGESVTLVPAVGNKRIHMSARKPVPPHRMLRQIRRYGHPDRVAVMDEMATRVHDGDPKAMKDWEYQAMTHEATAPIEIATPSLEPKKERFVKPAAKVPSPKQVAEKVKSERHIISERPHLMHKSLSAKGGRSYPSKTTVERRWSDGVIDYACAVSTCDKTSDSHLSFRGAHWAMHVRNGEAQPYDEQEAKKTVVDDPNYTEHAWSRKAAARQQRAEALANMLKGIDLSKITPEQLAEQIVEWLGDSGGGGGTGEPLTDAQVLDRIRALVDRGTYADQEKAILDRDKQIEELMQYAEKREQELEDEALLAEQRAVKAESTLSAFRDLVAEIMPPQEES